MTDPTTKEKAMSVSQALSTIDPVPSTDVERFTAEQPFGAHLPAKRELDAMMRMANAYAAMPGLAKSYAGKPDAVFSALLMAWSLDLPLNPLVVNAFYAWEDQGRTSLYPSAQMVVALAAKHDVTVWFGDDCDATHATAFCLRPGRDQADSYTYTIDMATKANLTNKPNWKAAPDVMLRYRAARRLITTVAPYVLLGIGGNLAGAEERGVQAVSRAALEAGAEVASVPDEPGFDDGDGQGDAPVPLASDEERAEVVEVLALVPAERRDALAEQWKAAGIASVKHPERFTVDDAARALALLADFMAGSNA